MYTKTLVFEGKKEGKYIYTKEPSRFLWGTPSRSIGKYRFWPRSKAPRAKFWRNLSPTWAKNVTKFLAKNFADFRPSISRNQRKTKGQQLKGKIVSEFFTLFRTFSHFFRIFPPGLSPSKQRVLAQSEQKRRKDNKKNWTNRCCTLVVARLSSS